MDNRNIDTRVALLRKEMLKKGIHVYIVPSADPHRSEYVADAWQCRAWISGFTGSAGVAVITKHVAHLWTDGRYFLQAESELENSEFELRKIDNAYSYKEWLKEKADTEQVVGGAGEQFSIKEAEVLQKIVAGFGGELSLGQDLIASIWSDRPSLSKNTITELSVSITGEKRANKLQTIRNRMQARHADVHIVSTLDDIAWILNLRGSDVACNPVFYAYLIIEMERVSLYVDMDKLSTELQQTLLLDNVVIKSYGDFYQDVSQINSALLLDEASTNYKTFEQLPKDVKLVRSSNVSTACKARKNSVEIEHIRNTHKKDALALVRLMAWLEDEVQKRAVPEWEVAEKLIDCRSKLPGYVGESFDAIVGYNANGAIIHYRPAKERPAKIQASGMLLLDSGGQYIDGTTDITRTFALGEPTSEQKLRYTQVLKGHIALSQAVFPKGTSGLQLDVLARQFLFKDAVNYNHGTGHGVGFYLNVHEGPQSISPRTSASTPLEKGMLISNEPGFYKDGEYGIRIENLVLVQEKEKNDFGLFYEFETVTLFPYENALMEVSLLTDTEKTWINVYHKRVKNELVSALEGKAREWLLLKCRQF